MENNKYLNMGLKLGRKLKKKPHEVQRLIYLGTSAVKDYNQIKDYVTQLCISEGVEIPDIIATLNEDNYLAFTAYMFGVNNGSLEK